MGIKSFFSNWLNNSDENYIETNETEYEDDFDFQPDNGGAAEQPEKQSVARARAFSSRSEKASKDNVVNINAPKAAAPAKPRVMFQQIDRFEDVNKVADVLKEKRIVVLNLESCPNEAAQRIIDVLYGVSYANDGDFKKIAARAYIITPDNVPVTGELGDDIASYGEDF